MDGTYSVFSNNEVRSSEPCPDGHNNRMGSLSVIDNHEDSRRCKRCGNECDEGEAKQLAAWLRLTCLPLFALRSQILVREAKAVYCKRCRRSMNVTLFFIVFMIGVACLFLFLQHVYPGPAGR